MSNRHSDQPWLKETAATRESNSFVGWYWFIWLFAPWLLYAEGLDLVLAAYIGFGLLGLLMMAVFKVQRHGVKFCPECKAGNPIDANLCQRCGTIPAPEVKKHAPYTISRHGQSDSRRPPGVRSDADYTDSGRPSPDPGQGQTRHLRDVNSGDAGALHEKKRRA